MGAHFLKNVIVAGRIRKHRNSRVILRGAAQHGGSPDVDVLDGLLKGYALAGDTRLEGIEVYDHHIYHADAVRRGHLHVSRYVAPRKQTTMHTRMERLYAPVHHFRKPGKVVYGPDRKAGLLQDTRRTAGRNNLNTKLLGEGAGKTHHTGFIRNRNESTSDNGVVHQNSFRSVTSIEYCKNLRPRAKICRSAKEKLPGR
jgi:hypothetical protein